MENKKNVLGEKPIQQLIFKIGVPTMIGMLITAIYSFVDATFVSRLGTSQLGAISVIFPVGQFVVSLGLLFGTGGGSYISRLLGLGSKDKASEVASVTITYSLVFGLIVIFCIRLFLENLLMFLGATNTILPFAMSYATIYFFALIFNVFNVTMTNIVVSEGKAKVSVYANLSGAVLNALLDPLLIYFFEMGIKGAAIATVISQFVSTVVYIKYIISGQSLLKISYKLVKCKKEYVVEIFKVGIPTFLFQVLTSVSISLGNMVAKPYGDTIIATMGAVSRILTIGNLIVFGFSKGLQPVAGFNYSAKKYKRLNEAIKVTNIWTSMFCVFFAIILILFPKPIISIFSKNDTQVIEFGIKALRLSGLSFVFFGYYTVYQTTFLALGKAFSGMIIGISRQGLFYVPLILTLPIFYGIDGIIYAQPLANILAVVLTVFLSFKLRMDIRNSENEIEGDIQI